MVYTRLDYACMPTFLALKWKVVGQGQRWPSLTCKVHDRVLKYRKVLKIFSRLKMIEQALYFNAKMKSTSKTMTISDNDIFILSSLIKRQVHYVSKRSLKRIAR